jgi:hypothetical protein
MRCELMIRLALSNARFRSRKRMETVSLGELPNRKSPKGRKVTISSP